LCTERQPDLSPVTVTSCDSQLLNLLSCQGCLSDKH